MLNNPTGNSDAGPRPCLEKELDRDRWSGGTSPGTFQIQEAQIQENQMD